MSGLRTMRTEWEMKVWKYLHPHPHLSDRMQSMHWSILWQSEFKKKRNLISNRNDRITGL
jgi:hypothetical protein